VQRRSIESLGATTLFDVTDCMKNKNSSQNQGQRRPHADLAALIRKRQRECMRLRQRGAQLAEDDSYMGAFTAQASVSEL
jgi:hypothetical protein